MPSLSVSPLLYLALQGKPGKPSLEMRTDLLHLWREITRQDVSSLTKPFEQLWICNTYNPPSLQGNARFVQVFGQGSCGRSGGEQRPTAAFSLEEGEGCSTAPRAEHAAGGPRGRPCSTSGTAAPQLGWESAPSTVLRACRASQSSSCRWNPGKANDWFSHQGLTQLRWRALTIRKAASS